MRQRSASAWALFGRLPQRSRVSRSSSLSTTGSRYVTRASLPPIVADDDRNARRRAYLRSYF